MDESGSSTRSHVQNGSIDADLVTNNKQTHIQERAFLPAVEVKAEHKPGGGTEVLPSFLCQGDKEKKQKKALRPPKELSLSCFPSEGATPYGEGKDYLLQPLVLNSESFHRPWRAAPANLGMIGLGVMHESFLSPLTFFLAESALGAMHNMHKSKGWLLHVHRPAFFL